MPRPALFAAALSFSLALGLGTAFAANPPAKPAAAAPAVIGKVTPELVLALVQGAGFTVKLDKSGDDPELTLSRKGSVTIYLNLHNCKTGSCTRADAYTYYASSDLDTAPAESDMSDWNSKNYTQAYIDSADDDSVNLDDLYYFKGGFTKANFLNWLNEFKKDADLFDKMLRAL